MPRQETINPAETHITGEQFLEGLDHLAKIQRDTDFLTSWSEDIIKKAAKTTGDLSQITNPEEVMAGQVEAARLSAERDSLRTELLQRTAGKMALVSVVQPDSNPLHAYQYMRYSPRHKDMGGMSFDRQVNYDIRGSITNIFFDGSFRLTPSRSGLVMARKVLMFGLGPRKDWQQAYRVYANEESNEPVISLQFE